MKVFRKIGVLTSGGDAPGMNAAIRAVTRAAISNGVQVVGIYSGYEGLIHDDVKDFTVRDVSNIVNHGGTVLFSARSPLFKTAEGMNAALETCRRHAIDGIVAIGGDGTFRGATDLTAHGVSCIGLPGTIDNDITATDYTIGFDTAMNTAIEMIDRLRDTCESHARCSVVEVMGRDAGDIALQTAIATGATGVVVPELAFDEAALIEKIRTSRSLGKRNFIVIVAEGLGSTFGEELTKRIEKETGVESRFARLAHVIRGGVPSLRDRLLATRMGEFAVDELLAGRSNEVICDVNNEICAVDIDYSLILDRMYKNKLKEGDLDRFTAAQIAEMQAACARRRASIESLYATVNRLNL